VTYPLEANQTLENAKPKGWNTNPFGNNWKGNFASKFTPQKSYTEMMTLGR
jgi:hypothetical protein